LYSQYHTNSNLNHDPNPDPIINQKTMHNLLKLTPNPNYDIKHGLWNRYIETRDLEYLTKY